jgi:hypothetical protein
LQYLQQFLALQEQRTLQQMQLLAMMQQEQQSFRLQLDSLIPQRGTGQSNTNTIIPGMMGAQRTNGSLSLGSTGTAMNGLSGNMLGGNGLQGNMNIAFQQQQVAAAAHQAAQQQQQLMNAANLLSRGMRRDGSSNNSNTSNSNMSTVANLRHLGSNSNDMMTANNSGSSNGLNLTNTNTAGSGALNRAALQTLQMQQQLQSLQQLAAAAIVDFNSSGMNNVATTAVATPSSSFTPAAQADFLNSSSGTNAHEVHSSEQTVTNILGKRIFLIQDNELLGLPAFSSGPDLRLIGFYLEDNNMGQSSSDEEVGWKFRPIQFLDAFQDEVRAKILSKLILDQWKDPSNRQDGICFDVSSFEGNLSAMKKSISLILKELEENEGKDDIPAI